MQREIKKKTLTYGVAAVLLVSVLAASIYNFGGQFTPTQTLLAELNTFSSFEELENFITTNMETANQNAYALDSLKNSREETLTLQDTAGAMPMAPTEADGEDDKLTDYSGTNLQVEGVDEADMIKTDGEYIYIVSGGNITIVKAYPPEEAKVVSKSSVDGSITGIFVKDSKLVVFETEYSIYPYYGVDIPVLETADSQVVNDVQIDDEEPIKSTEPSNQTNSSKEPEGPIEEDIEPAKPLIPIYEPPTSNIKIYDISNKANPVLTRTVSLDGSLTGSRMIGDYVYIVNNELATQPNYNNEDVEVVLPVIKGDDVIEVKADRVHYIDVADEIYYLTTIVAINTQDDAAEPTYEAFLTSSTSNMYVSLNNMYLIAPDTNGWLSIRSDVQPRQETLIYRVKLDEQNILVEAEGSVPGFILNQFSMDEHNGYFRIATTEWTSSWTEETFTSESTNNLFVLDLNLNIIGKLENIAPDESIYSVRFMGDKVYMVTFKQIDPFFVIDTSNPTQPTILGYLKIPGYSSYLHPYDENHIIGLGIEDGNLKLSMFDVTDFTSPKEIAKYTVEGSWSSSTALWDHKAFLFDKTKNLLAIPVSINTYTEIYDKPLDTDDMPRDTNGSVVDGDEEQKEETNTDEARVDMISPGSYYQGAYIFDVTVEQGFILKGDITHPSNNQYQDKAQINRIIYIENTLYTISDQLVKINNLESLQPITQIQLS